MGIKLSDFCFMRQGRRIRPLLPKEAHLLVPMDSHKPTQVGHPSRAILLIHGFASSPAVWRALAPKLALTYDAVVCPALAGHAENLEIFSQATAKEWLASAQDALNNLTPVYDQVDVMGLSLGGLIACYLSQQMPIHHLYLLAPALKLKKINISLAFLGLKCLKTLGIRQIKNYGGNLCDPTYEELLYHHIPIHAIQEILRFIAAYDWKIPTCKTDLFLGKKDAVVDSGYIKNRFQQAAASMRIHMLDNSAHVLPLDYDRTVILNRISQNAQEAGAPISKGKFISVDSMG